MIFRLLFLLLCGFVISMDSFAVMLIRGAQKAELSGRWIAFSAVLIAPVQILSLLLSNRIGYLIRTRASLWILPQVFIVFVMAGLIAAGLMMIFRGHKARRIPERRIEKLGTKPGFLIGLMLAADAFLLGLVLGLARQGLGFPAAAVITGVSFLSTAAGAATGYRYGFEKQNLLHGLAAAVLFAAAIWLGLLTFLFKR